MAASGQHFYDESDARRAAREFEASAATDAYEVWDTEGRWYWHARSSNGKLVATGGQSFANKYDAKRAAENVRDNAGLASCP